MTMLVTLILIDDGQSNGDDNNKGETLLIVMT